MQPDLIAPCGMNCGVCIAYLAREHDLNRHGFRRTYCPGCLPRGENCTFMGNACDLLARGLVRFCFECARFPCRRLKALDKRYRTKYHTSMLDNLEFIRLHGLEAFLEREEKWRCPRCGGAVCCHNGLCLGCDLDTLRRNPRYRWGEPDPER